MKAIRGPLEVQAVYPAPQKSEQNGSAVLYTDALVGALARRGLPPTVAAAYRCGPRGTSLRRSDREASLALHRRVREAQLEAHRLAGWPR